MSVEIRKLTEVEVLRFEVVEQSELDSSKQLNRSDLRTEGRWIMESSEFADLPDIK
ncbi:MULTISPECIES: hypothetical protein [Vibrio]|uniref:hypothetical protein n=1 Tax=Vibrio TaxID=662 RepID=UPI00078C11BB|nr:MULTISPECIES: hypothetical protein [Vibrio]BAU70914.1 hypothetical protein [Vibrio sp. 04Ya108]BBM67829.1 hypothetical protein VA249_44750 [Vibrio alfacsensis]BCN26999.1 hypothetical protein VYA_41910 [Vibrio alfacsensis]